MSVRHHDDLLTYLSSKIQEEYAVISEDLASGTAKDYGDYKYACGTARGLLIANNLIAELANHMENLDE